MSSARLSNSASGTLVKRAGGGPDAHGQGSPAGTRFPHSRDVLAHLPSQDGSRRHLRCEGADVHKPSSSIESDVRDGLDWDPMLDDERIFIQASDVGLSDEIVISGESSSTDVDDRIRKAFRRNAILDGSRIEVSGSGNIIYLDGTTSSWAAMEEAVETAGEAPGVTEVVNRLVVRP